MRNLVQPTNASPFSVMVVFFPVELFKNVTLKPAYNFISVTKLRPMNEA